MPSEDPTTADTSTDTSTDTDTATGTQETSSQPQVVSEQLPDLIGMVEKVRLYKLRVGRVVRGLVARRITLSDYYTVPVIREYTPPEGGDIRRILSGIPPRLHRFAAPARDDQSQGQWGFGDPP